MQQSGMITFFKKPSSFLILGLVIGSFFSGYTQSFIDGFIDGYTGKSPRTELAAVDQVE